MTNQGIESSQPGDQGVRLLETLLSEYPQLAATGMRFLCRVADAGVLDLELRAPVTPGGPWSTLSVPPASTLEVHRWMTQLAETDEPVWDAFDLTMTTDGAFELTLGYPDDRGSNDV